MNPRNFFAELKRRNVSKVAVAYAVIAWLLIQAGSILFPTFEAPGWVMKVFVTIVVAGFPIALVIAWAFEMTPEGIKRTENVSPNEHIPQWSRRKFAMLIVSVALLAGGLLIFQLWRTQGLSTAATLSQKSIAVLPLVNQSGDSSQEYFSDGLSEELINGLGQIHELRVIGRNSSFHFKGKSDDSRAVGLALGVANLLEGSVRKAGDRVRISVALVDAANGSQRWSQTYDRELKDIFAVQEEIARSVADQLRITLLGGEVAASGRPSNGSVPAYNAYLQGQQYHRSGNIERLPKAIEFYDEAIRLDPRYAEAYAFKALAWAQIGVFRGVKGTDAFEQARAAAKAALAIKPDLEQAHSAMANSYFSDWNLAAAEAEFKGSAQNATSIPNMLANVRAFQGRADEALQLQRQAVAHDPAFHLFRRNLASRLIAVGRLEEAEAESRKAVELQPQATGVHLDLVVLALLRGQPEVAWREAQLEASGVVRDTAIALAQAARGDRAEADAALKVLIDAHGDESPFRIAGVYAYRKEPEKVFEWLDRAYALHDPRLITLHADPLLRAYNADPRFGALCQKVGLPVPK
jgi:TolB-like protein/Flp pilus assembly protein TadD